MHSLPQSPALTRIVASSINIGFLLPEERMQKNAAGVGHSQKKDSSTDLSLFL
jgi:hypothetical protein